MHENFEVARAIADARTADYSAALWADVPLTDGPGGPFAAFPDIVGAALVGRNVALAPARSDVRLLPPSDIHRHAVAVLVTWLLDAGYFRFSLAQAPVALLFGADPVAVSPEDGARLAVSAARCLSGYQEEDADKRARAAPLLALEIKESTWGSPLPEEWI